ncbi:protein disulfide-isomerase precursor [Cytospora paraplurivora]|uniref:Protein disulfide-isomerase n=1 Tax=Cytospora paraplurivora TaxID=2898453 RepID=A0AAN9UI16_9PEZI
MRRVVSLTLGFLGLAAGALFEDSPTALDLRPAEFKALIQESNVVMADFYAPWCRHCTTFAPKYEAAAKTLKEQNIDVKLAKVDCTRHSIFCQEYSIRAYPTLKIFKGGQELYHEYDGPRRASAIVEFVTKQLLPTVSVLTGKGQHDAFLAREREEVVLIGYFSPDDQLSNASLAAAAEKLHEDIPIGVTSDAAAAAAVGIDFPAIVLHQPNDEGKVVYGGAFDDVEAIKAFAKTSYTPLIGELGQDTWKNYVSGANGPTAFIFARTDAERKRLSDELRPLARRHKGSLSFATAEVPDFAGFAGYLHLDNNAEKNFPAFAIYDGAGKRKFPFAPQGKSEELTAGSVGRFVEDFLGGRLVATVNSEPVPSAQSGPVTKVVANNFRDIVLDDRKDVLLYYFRDDCPYCRALNPVYDNLALAYRSQDNVVVAKIDITKNDLPEDVPYIPYVKLYKAGDKSSPVLYQGQRTLQDMTNFMKENGGHGVEAVHEQAVGEDRLGSGDIAQEPLQGVTPVKHIHDEL